MVLKVNNPNKATLNHNRIKSPQKRQFLFPFLIFVVEQPNILSSSSQNIMNHMAMHIGQPNIPSPKTKGLSDVVNP